MAVTARRFNRYPAYKNSGVEWLGDIPAHWEVKRLKRVAQFQGGGTPAKDNVEYWRGEIPWVSPKDMKVSLVVDTEDKITADAIRESATKLVPAGAVLMVVRSGILAHSIPVALAGCEVTLNQDLKAMVPRFGLSPEYLMYFIAGMQRELLVVWKKEGATVESLELESVVRTPTPLPSSAEQRAIAAFLDRETARIDTLVAKKERLIELLHEKRTALITRAVTKGLDPTVPMKDSGVEWLGEIPTHWGVRAVWTLFSMGRGRVISHEEIHEHQGPYPVFSSQTENDGVMGHISTHDFDGAYLTWTTDGARAGTVFARTGRFNCTNVCGTLKAQHSNQLDLGFMRDALNVATGWFVRHDINPKLMNNVMARIRVQVPPSEEQHDIAAFLDRETSRIDALVAKVRDAVERLKDLRTALISAAVTGKIDVREETS